MYGLSPAEASGYIVGWLQDARKETPEGSPERNAIDALERTYASGLVANKDSSYQLRTVYPVLAQMAPKTAAVLRRQVTVIGTPEERAAIGEGVVAAKKAGIKVKSIVPMGALALGIGLGLFLVVWGFLGFAFPRRRRR